MSGAGLARRYDAAILHPEARALYDGTDFFNVGDWSGGAAGLGEAARRLVERHLAVDPPHEAAAVGRVLDAGCGLGAGAAMMAAHYAGALVIGANISPSQLAHAAAAARRARFAAMDGARLAIASASLDRIHCIEAAFHFDSRDAFLAEAARVLKPGGRLVLTDITFRRPYGGGVPAANLWDGEDEYRRRCESAGFRIELFDDISEHTLRPFFKHLEAVGLKAQALQQSRAMADYYFAVLTRKDPGLA